MAKWINELKKPMARYVILCGIKSIKIWFFNENSARMNFHWDFGLAIEKNEIFVNHHHYDVNPKNASFIITWSSIRPFFYRNGPQLLNGVFFFHHWWIRVDGMIFRIICLIMCCWNIVKRERERQRVYMW